MAQHTLAAFEVGNGAGHLQDAAIGTGGELQAFHGHTEHIEAGGIGFCKLVEHALGHLGIAVDDPHPGPSRGEGAEASLLDLPGLDDPLADLRAGLSRLHFAQGGKRHGLYLTMDINTVQQRTTNLVHVPLYLPRGAYTMVGRVSIEPTRTGVHRC